MKKFFKTLALLLALTLVIGTIPAAAAEAKPLESKILFVDGAKGTTEAGKACKIGKRVALWKLAGFESNAAYADHEVKATVADETVAHATKYFVYADAIGKTKVTLTVDGEKAGEVALTVKKNATADTLVITGLEEGGEYYVGQTIDVTLPRVGADTDARALSIEGANVAAGEKARTYVVSFDKAGEYEVKYSAFQSKSFSAPTQEKSFKVTAKFAKAELKQTASDTFTLTFPEGVDMTGKVNADSFAAADIYYMIGVSEVPFSFVKEASGKANVVTVKMASAFAAKEVYTVVFGGVEYTLTGAGVGVKDVVRMEITTKSVIAGEDAEISYKFYNAADVEVALDTVKGDLSLDTKSDDAYVIDATHVKFFDKEKTAEFVATLSQGFDDDWNPIEVKSEPTTIVSVEKAAAAYTGTMKVSFEAIGAEYITKDTKAEKLNSFLTVGEVKDVQALFQYSDGKDTSFVDYAGMGFDYIESSNGNIVLVNSFDFDEPEVVITAVAEGKANLICYATKDGKEVPQLVIPVTVKEARKASTISIAKQTGAYLNNAKADDKITVEFEVKDQHGALIAATLVAKQNDANKKAVAEITVPSIVDNGGTGKYKMEIPHDIFDAETNKPKVFKIEVQDSAKKLTAVSFSFSVNDVTEAKSTVLTCDNEAINTALVGASQTADAIKDATVKLVNTNGNYAVSGGPVLSVELEKAPTTAMKAATGSATEAYYAFYVTKDGEVKKVADLKNVDFAAGEITFDAINGEDAKLAKGTYKVFAYKVTESDDAKKGTKYEPIGSKTIVVTDSQVTPNFKLVSSNVAKDGDIADCFEWYFNGQDKGKDIVNVDYAVDYVEGENGQVFIKKVKVTVALKELGSFTFDVNVNKLFTFEE